MGDGALATGNGATAKVAVAGKTLLARQRVRRGERCLAHTSTLPPSICGSLVPYGTEGLHEYRRRARNESEREGNKNKETVSVQSTLNVLPSIWDHQEGDTPELRRMHTPKKKRWKINCGCGTGAYLHNRFGGNVASRSPWEESGPPLVDGRSAADSCNKQRVGGHSHDGEPAEARTKGNGTEWSIHQENERPLCHLVHPRQNDKTAHISPSLLHRNMPP